MEVDLSEVRVHVDPAISPSTHTAAADWEMPQPHGFDPQYVRHLFITSIQAAVALVRDAEDSAAHRATHRITVLLRLMDGWCLSIFYLLLKIFLLYSDCRGEGIWLKNVTF